MLWFSKKKEINPDETVFERYKTDFGIFSKNRFPVLDENGYSTAIKKGGYQLSLFRKNIFSWVPASMFQYRDFMIESEFEFHKNNPHSAFGFIFRFVNNENFYFFLISNHGMFRFDVLFNGTPLHLVEWTASEHLLEGKNTIRIIAHSDHFSFFANDEWIAEIDDEKLFSGRVGIAGQNYDEADEAGFQINDFVVESRSIEVEKAFYRWVKYVPVEPVARIGLAKTLFGQGNFSNAAILLKKALKNDPENIDAALLYSECCINLRLYSEAFNCIENFLQGNPFHLEARLEKANLFYLQNRFSEAKEYIKSIITDIKDSATLWNLLGNTEYALGNWKEADSAYSAAAKISPAIPLYHINRAHTAEQLGDIDTACTCYVTAAHYLFENESYDELESVISVVLRYKPESDEAKALQAKMLFHEEKYEQSRPLLEKLAAKNIADSGVYYLLGLFFIKENRRSEALAFLEKAAGLDPEYPLYVWRLAENKRLLGREYVTEIEQAKKLAPDDPWVNNLFGLYYIDQTNLKKAEEHLTLSFEKMPHEADIIINLSEVYFLQGKTAEALELLDRSIEKHMAARLYNQRGNIHVRTNEYDSAVADYELAIRQEPRNPLYRENCAAACIEADQYTRANELLVALVDDAPSAPVFNLLGNLASIRGEFKRAEASFQEALALSPDDPQIKTNLAAFYTDKLAYTQARELVSGVLAHHPDYAPALKLQNAIRKRFETEILCSACNRQWWVPLNPGPQELGKIVGEPPAEAPAGKCPSCGKIYCIGCAQAHLRDKRFVCPDCDEPLKLPDDSLKYLLKEYIGKQLADNPPEKKDSRPLFRPKS
ncbi:MAG: tetratricopeptide repeat protein [Spirochaetales bacterium]|nr:tetratricopeptide repeat protein [Spirochaetales bacterium]